MNTFKFALISLKRDWYSGELRLISISIILAVACLTSVSFFVDRVHRATEQHATELLAADLVIISSAKINSEIIKQAIDSKLIYSLNESFRSVVVKDEKLELAEVKAVDTNYPIHGKLKISDSLFGKEQITKAIPATGTVWIDSRLMQTLQVSIGETVNLGASELTVSKRLTYEPDRGGDLFNIAPRLLMNRDDLEATGLILPASRVQYRLLLGGNIDVINQFRKTLGKLQSDKDNNLRIQSIRDARPEIRSALERAEQFLGLATLVSIALAGLAIAMSAQRYATRHYDTCAIMRCLGLQQNEISHIFLFQLLILGFICSLIGCGFGYIAQEGLNKLMIGISQTSLPKPSLLPFLKGIFSGLLTVLAFALPQLFSLRTVSPLRVLRRDLNPLPIKNYIIYLIAILTLIFLSPWQSGSIKITFHTLLGLFITAIVLALSAKQMLRLLKYFQPKLKMAARYGLANVTHRANQSTVQIIGIGLGITVMLLLTLIRTDLLENWKNRLPENAPNYFLINIQPNQVEQLKSILLDSLDREIFLHPMIRGRLTKINDVAINIVNYNNPRAKRLATREFNLSYAETMQEDNRLAAGSWWPEESRDKNYFSVEQGIAETLGIKPGDDLTYSIAGELITGNVTSLRWLEWDSFNVNFFVVANPEALSSHPSTFITSFYLPESKRGLLVDLVKQFPSITVLDMDAILTQVKSIMQQVIRAVEFVFIFTLLTGFTVLFAAIQSTHDERTNETAMMSALGASRKQIVSGLVAEFLFLGLITGILSAVAASIIELVLAEYIFKIHIDFNPLIWILTPIVCCLIIVSAGLFGTRKVLSTSPMAVLRKI
ncbi:MAG: FtsX-like permease family protein [Proteobacteria bacterium]|nr:FtsX-like permease family protein [Pseudomonadota bacterium]NOG61030.1 FtsX-like permease family protein [Pseudomonadota bacterium]